jgi:hypothetical protein
MPAWLSPQLRYKMTSQNMQRAINWRSRTAAGSGFAFRFSFYFYFSFSAAHGAGSAMT